MPFFLLPPLLFCATDFQLLQQHKLTTTGFKLWRSWFSTYLNTTFKQSGS
ncbi:hypothetical protein AB3S75_040536 [Citrus x aurantiifolia]